MGNFVKSCFQFPELKSWIKLIYDSVKNVFHPTCDVHNNENEASLNFPFTNFCFRMKVFKMGMTIAAMHRFPDELISIRNSFRYSYACHAIIFFVQTIHIISTITDSIRSKKACIYSSVRPFRMSVQETAWQASSLSSRRSRKNV